MRKLQDLRLRQRDRQSPATSPNWLKGKHIDEAMTIKNTVIVKELICRR